MFIYARLAQYFDRFCGNAVTLREGSFTALEVTSNPDIVEEEYEQEEDEDIEGHEAAGQQEVHLQRIPEELHHSRQSQP